MVLRVAIPTRQMGQLRSRERSYSIHPGWGLQYASFQQGANQEHSGQPEGWL